MLTEIVINRPRDVVAVYAANPTNAPEWYVNIDSVEWKTAPPVQVGSRMAFVARFLGRRLAYTYEIIDLVPGERLVISFTRMTLRNRGEPSGFSKVSAPLMAAAMRRANRKDLVALKRLMERT